jgi:hypothetical protein
LSQGCDDGIRFNRKFRSWDGFGFLPATLVLTCQSHFYAFDRFDLSIFADKSHGLSQGMDGNPFFPAFLNLFRSCRHFFQTPAIEDKGVFGPPSAG